MEGVEGWGAMRERGTGGVEGRREVGGIKLHGVTFYRIYSVAF